MREPEEHLGVLPAPANGRWSSREVQRLHEEGRQGTLLIDHRRATRIRPPTISRACASRGHGQTAQGRAAAASGQISSALRSLERDPRWTSNERPLREVRYHQASPSASSRLLEADRRRMALFRVPPEARSRTETVRTADRVDLSFARIPSSDPRLGASGSLDFT